jgi:hypothetical protein
MSHNLQRIRIDQINIGRRFRKEIGALDSLSASIKGRGLMQPIVVCQVEGGYRLIAGERRLRTVRDVLGESMIEAKVYDEKDELTIRLMEWDENAERKEMTPSEKAELGKEIERLLGERRGRPANSQKPNENQGENSCQMAGISGKESAEVAAEAVGFDSSRTYHRAKHVVENGAAETIEAMDEGVIAVADAAAIANEPKTTQATAVAAVKKGKTRTAKAAVAGRKAGQVVYDDRKIDDLIGKLPRALDDRHKAHGKRHPTEHADCLAKLNLFEAAWKRWQKAST